MRAKSAQNAFEIREFETWKLATTVFRQHELSAFRNEAVERVITLSAETTDTGVAISCSSFFCNQSIINVNIVTSISCNAQGIGH